MRRVGFLFGQMLISLILQISVCPVTAADQAAPEPLHPIGKAQGIHPGRVVWVHDPQVVDWGGPGDGHWYEGNHTRQDRADAMMNRTVCELTGEKAVGRAWDELFRYLNQKHGKGNTGYRRGEKVAIKPNWVGMIWHEGNVDKETGKLIHKQDYMNTSPHLIAALVRQLVREAGVKESDITVSDTLAWLADEYYEVIHNAFPEVKFVDYGGKPGRIKAKESAVAFYWSCRPEGKTPDVLPTFLAEADYIVNFANLKAHTGAGVTLCGKNNFGSLVRWPVQQGYYDMHRGAFLQEDQAYREQVDLMGHSQLGGKTVLYLIDGLFTGKHPVETAPRKMDLPPFSGDWPKSLFGSQDPVAIDSVGFDFLRVEFIDTPRRPGVDSYLHEAALADSPPSGTFYDPDHAQGVRRLASLGVHEHWNNPTEKKYSRNLGKPEGIELIAIEAAGK